MKKIEKNFYSNKIFKLLKKFRTFFTFQGLIHETDLITLGSIKRCFYVLNIFLYTQVVSAFVFQEDFDICLGPFFAFCLFLLQKDFNIFHMLLFGVFLCVFNNTYSPFFIQKNRNYFLIFLIRLDLKNCLFTMNQPWVCK